MFERYTPNARRAIYFARTEALARNSLEIETKDLLLGLTAAALISLGWSVETLRTLSAESRKLFPPKRLPLRKLLDFYRRPTIGLAINLSVAITLLAALILYLRWPQR